MARGAQGGAGMKQPVVLVVLGTRPEAIKLWPVIEELRKRDLVVLVESTGQQQHLLEPLLQELGIKLKYAPMTRSADGFLADFLAEAISWLTRRMVEADLVVVQGDTTTALAGALAAFYAQVPVAHIEAGLRTYDLASPFPEEGNRQMISRIASLHFCPTDENRLNIIEEKASPLDEDGGVFAVGNTVVDAVKRIMVEELLDTTRRADHDILVTFHRRESWAEAAQVARAIAELAHRYAVTWVKHANPRLRSMIEEAIFSHRFEQEAEVDIRFVEPMGYRAFLRALYQAELVITDSGGVVEECTTLGKPCLMLRNATERAEALTAGHRILGTDELEHLPAVVGQLLVARYDGKIKPSDAFGDGHAAGRIVAHIQDFLRTRS